MDEHSTAVADPQLGFVSPRLIPARVRIEAAEDSHVARAAKIRVDDLDFYYGPKQALSQISLTIRPNVVTAFIGPSGCGKSTFLRCIWQALFCSLL